MVFGEKIPYIPFRPVLFRGYLEGTEAPVITSEVINEVLFARQIEGYQEMLQQGRLDRVDISYRDSPEFILKSLRALTRAEQRMGYQQ